MIFIQGGQRMWLSPRLTTHTADAHASLTQHNPTQAFLGIDNCFVLHRAQSKSSKSDQVMLVRSSQAKPNPPQHANK